MKKATAALCCLMMLLLANSACGESAPLIYQVSDDEGHTIYLLGTMHVGEESMYPLGDAVEKAWQETDILAVEMDLVAFQQDMAAAMQYSMALMYLDGTTIADHIDLDIYARGMEALLTSEAVMNSLGVGHMENKMELAEAALKMMRPMAWISLMEELSFARIGYSAELGVDMWLLNRAHEEGKTIHELEGLESQMDTLLSMPDAIAEYQMEQYFLYPEASDISLKLLVTAWRQGNEEIFSLLMASDTVGIPKELEEIYQEYTDNLLHKRDDLFEQKAIEYLKSGEKVLFAVGAAHIVGEGALAERLEKAGYTVTEIGR